MPSRRAPAAFLSWPPATEAPAPPMFSLPKQWKTPPQGKLVEVEDDLLSTVADGARRMTVVRLRDGRLVAFGAVALARGEVHQLEGYGRLAFLVVPGAVHRHDAAAWKQRYPAMQVVAPAGARAQVERAVRVDTAVPAFGDGEVDFVAVPGTREREAALVVRRPGGTTLLLDGVVANARGEPGFGGRLLRLAGLAGRGPRIPRAARLRLIDDKEALRAVLLDWAQLPSLGRILASRGAPIDEQPAQALRELARSLA